MKVALSYLVGGARKRRGGTHTRRSKAEMENVPSGEAQAPPRPHRYVEETEPGVRLAQRLPSAPTGIPGSDFLDGSRMRLATIPPRHPLWTIS